MKEYTHVIEKMIDENFSALLNKTVDEAFGITNTENFKHILDDEVLVENISAKIDNIWRDILSRKEVKEAVVLDVYQWTKHDAIFLKFADEKDFCYGIRIWNPNTGSSYFEWTDEFFIDSDHIKIAKQGELFKDYYKMFGMEDA